PDGDGQGAGPPAHGAGSRPCGGPAHGGGAQDPGPARGGPHQPPDRRAPLPGGEDRQELRVQPAPEAGHAPAHRGRRLRGATRRAAQATPELSAVGDERNAPIGRGHTSGTHHSMTVPLGLPARMSKEPPRAVARAAMLWSPWPREPSGARGPMPSSLTRSTSLASSTAT